MRSPFPIFTTLLAVSALLGATDCDRPASMAAPTAAASSSAAAVYRCPMHPEIVRDAPGQCPICNMTLEPVPAASTSAAPPSMGSGHGQSHAP